MEEPAMARRAHLAAILPMALAASALASPAPDADRYWPQWRGPEGNGAAPHGDPPLTWSETSNVRFKVEIPGRGHASPVVWEDRIYLLTAVDVEGAAGAPAVREVQPAPAPREASASSVTKTSQPPAALPQAAAPPAATATAAPGSTGGEAPPAAGAPAAGGEPPRPGQGRFRGGVLPDRDLRFVVLALDRSTGRVVWERTARQARPHEGTHTDGTWASASAVADGERVFASFGSQGLYCYGRDGRLLWQKDLGDMQVKNGFGEGSSPALFAGTLVVNWDHEGESFLAALDAASGEERWRVAREEKTSWSTPLVVEVGGKPQVVVSATGKVRSYDLATGALVWETGGMTANAIPSPVAAGGLLFVTSGFRGNALLAIRLASARGDITGTEAVAWSHDRDTPYVPSPLLYDDVLYVLKHNSGVVTAFEAASGKVLYGPERLPEIEGVYASPVAAAGRVYVAGRDGATVVLAHGREPKVLAVNRLDEGCEASLAIVEREIFLRGRRHLYALADQGPKAQGP
jgi:outer membrane protein assembly factor BamB